MTHSVIPVSCGHCPENYHGVLQGIFLTDGEYVTTCPICNKQNFIRSYAVVAGAIDADIPENSVPVMVVKVI
ncbi:hypothetical protein [Photobacterium carnosum]|uniref:hypothetical protein n=1 Tax=Photobacterium carnosum TaxID=2023717 RepID=UPI001E2905A1|nr:hypothetical protein [Photobacterium carnosum]MCD9513881.1 hypothetical protein [Photobacterium carnosum]